MARASALTSQYTRGCPVQPSVGWAGIFSILICGTMPIAILFFHVHSDSISTTNGLARQVMAKAAPSPILRPPTNPRFTGLRCM